MDRWRHEDLAIDVTVGKANKSLDPILGYVIVRDDAIERFRLQSMSSTLTSS
jgi:hypothetical protein